MRTFGQITGKSTNLHFLRFIAAVSVIISHSFAVGFGNGDLEWISRWTRGQLSLGAVAVAVFFCAGGYLIAGSAQRSSSAVQFFKARIIRILPLLFVVVVLSMFVLGPILTTKPINDYFGDTTFYKYGLNALLIPQHNLPGVFLNSPYNPTVNGSLWTLPVEFVCYIGCYLFFRLKLLHEKTMKYTVPVVIIGWAAVLFAAQRLNIPIGTADLRPLLLFYAGMLFYVYRNKIVARWQYASISFIAIIAGAFTPICNYIFILFFPYLLFYISFAAKQLPKYFLHMGNYSYGIYLCAFPIQQIIVCQFFNGKMSPYLNMCIAVPISILVGVMLYFAAERPLDKWLSHKKTI